MGMLPDKYQLQRHTTPLVVVDIVYDIEFKKRMACKTTVK